ncbi:MAG: polysaccharide biosynthesis tyrosine autokinase [Calditrichia bacterium]
MNTYANGQSPGPGGFVDSENEMKKYLRILKKRKWMIMLVTALVFLGWLGFVIMYQSKPVYLSSAFLRFEGQDQVGGLERGREDSDSRTAILRTNTLLGKVVDELHLNLSIVTDDVSRKDLFEFIDLTPESVFGYYRIDQAANGYELRFSEQDESVANGDLLTNFALSDTLWINDMGFRFNAGYVGTFENWDDGMVFRVIHSERAIGYLSNRIRTRWVDRKAKKNLELSVSHPSPWMAAKTANSVAEHFVQLDSDIKNRKSIEAQKNLEEQLVLARTDLEGANQKLQEFQERNPGVGQPAGLATIGGLQASQTDIDFKLNDLNTMISRLSSTPSMDGKITETRQLLQQLMSEGVPAAAAFQQEFETLMAERTQLLGNYSPTSSFVTENSTKINAMIPKVAAAARETASKLASRRSGIRSQISRERYRQGSLPRKQRELSELSIVQQSKKELYETILRRYNQAKIKREVEVGDVFILDRATVPPLQGRLKLIVTKSLLGIILGLGLGVGLSIILEFFDKTVQSSEDLASRLKLPVLGTIPVIENDDEVPENIRDIKGKRDTKLITLDYSPTLESESYRDLRTKILFANNRETPLSSFLITSLRPGEGKSLTSSNLAITFAQQKISTLIIDADLRRGVLHNVYGNKKKPGLSDFLISKATVDYDNVNKLVQKTIIPNLYLISTGSPIPNPTEMLGSERMTNLLKVLKSRFGMVILDTAPFEASSDAPILSTHVDGALIVVRADYTNVDNLSHKINEYPNIHRKILGLVLNAVKADMNKNRYQYSYYNY